VVGSGLAPEAHAIAESLGKPSSADNDLNYLRSLNFQVVEVDYLDDAHANCWWIMDLEAFRLNAIWWNRVGLEVVMAESFDDLAAKWRAYDRHSWYVADWRAIYGHYVAP
jgi:hypothetical protein